VGALPKRKVSQARRGNRRSHDIAKKANLVPCPNCHAMRLSHRVCTNCGHYRGVEIIEKKAKKAKPAKGE
jgi:LSU ribosomal protein L32P